MWQSVLRLIKLWANLQTNIPMFMSLLQAAEIQSLKERITALEQQVGLLSSMSRSSTFLFVIFERVWESLQIKVSLEIGDRNWFSIDWVIEAYAYCTAGNFRQRKISSKATVRQFVRNLFSSNVGGHSFDLRSFGCHSFAYRLSSHSLPFLIPPLVVLWKFRQEFNPLWGHCQEYKIEKKSNPTRAYFIRKKKRFCLLQPYLVWKFFSHW